MPSLGAGLVASLAGWLIDDLVQPLLGTGRHVGPVIRLLDGDLLRGAKVADRAEGQLSSGVRRTRG